MDDIDTPLSQRDEARKQDVSPENPKRLTKMRYDTSPSPLQERTRGMTRPPTHKNGKG
jgi:hypothetical protein